MATIKIEDKTNYEFLKDALNCIRETFPTVSTKNKPDLMDTKAKADKVISVSIGSNTHEFKRKLIRQHALNLLRNIYMRVVPIKDINPYSLMIRDIPDPPNPRLPPNEYAVAVLARYYLLFFKNISTNVLYYRNFNIYYTVYISSHITAYIPLLLISLCR